MKKDAHNTGTPLNIDYKGKKKQAQLKIILELLETSQTSLTALQIHYITGIRIQNVTRRIGDLKDNNQIEIEKEGRCPISNHPDVQFLKAVTSPFIQLRLFDNEGV